MFLKLSFLFVVVKVSNFSKPTFLLKRYRQVSNKRNGLRTVMFKVKLSVFFNLPKTALMPSFITHI